MNYYSLNGNSPDVNFREAVIRGIAPDRGLYFPSEIPALPSSFFSSIDTLDRLSIATQVIKPFVSGSIPEHILEDIIEDVLNFDFPLIQLSENLATLELFHGPTMAFKDVGARFMARCLGYFNRDNDKTVTVLVATSGDTGGAVADGFKGVDGVRVVILYPRGKVSDIQERQLCTQGSNVTAIEVEGDFDACQAFVKKAFLDPDITNEVQLTSANSINVARWLPQMFYYFFAYQQAGKHRDRMVMSVPSGNFGNICAGLLAHRLGLPIRHYIASTNVNDTVPQFLSKGTYEPKPSVPTLSNAMDVGDPSNFVRILELFSGDNQALAPLMSAQAFTDKQTRNALVELHQVYGYIGDPHGAVGYLGLKNYLESNNEMFGVFLETAHPIKFKETVEETLGLPLPLPEQAAHFYHREKHKVPARDYADIKAILLA